MTDSAALSDLDLAALVCSRVCHDVIAPVGAIANGLEVLDEAEGDDEMQKLAMAMIRSSTRQAAARLKFCRIAFGAAGSAGAVIDLGEAGEVARAYVGDEKIRLDWRAPPGNRPKSEVKLLLNMLLLGIGAIPRGGTLAVTAEDKGFTVHAVGERAKIPEAIAEVLNGRFDPVNLDARLVQPYYARRLAASAGLGLTAETGEGNVVLKAG